MPTHVLSAGAPLDRKAVQPHTRLVSTATSIPRTMVQLHTRSSRSEGHNLAFTTRMSLPPKDVANAVIDGMAKEQAGMTDEVNK